MAIFSVALLAIWNSNRARTENLILGCGWALVSAGFITSQLSPDSLGRAIIAITHVPYSFAAVCFCSGLLMRVKIKPPVTMFLAIAVTGSCVMAFTQTFGNSATADLYVTNLSTGAITLLTAQLFVRGAKTDFIDRFVLWMLAFTAAQFFIRPVLSLMSEGPIAGAEYRDTLYYLALNWVFAFGSVLFGLSHIAGAVKDQIEALKDESARDTLSGLLVRGEFEARVNDLLAKANAKRIDVALVIGDIDHFKQINDIWGHQKGDSAIAGFGQMISGTIRNTDIAGRVGGEEFCIVVWGATERDAAGLAHRLRARAKTLQIGEDTIDARLTASFGVAGRRTSEGYRSLFARADNALYEAKQRGRDCVVTEADIGSPSSGSEPSTGAESEQDGQRQGRAA